MGEIIFISSPYSSTNKELKEYRFKNLCEVCGLILNRGNFPLSPVVHGVPIAEHCDLPDDFDFWGDYCKKMIDISDRIYVLLTIGWDSSKGVKDEIDYAKKIGKAVFLVSPSKLNGVTELKLIEEL